ncbi:MAG: ribbon-helix-helix protein, CopG family [Clostridia bacterium]|nr:ribbon-helix-helix protein, CopG family [Clostridia bacterium]
MPKSLYSLTLSDEVVARIDRLAVRERTNRSALVNRILAEYCSLTTPEKRIESVFAAVERAFSGSGDRAEDGELATFLTPNAQTMFLKTSLAYRYRPTVRYDLRLYPTLTETGAAGELTVTFRTQSSELLARIEAFFRAWIREESRRCAEERLPHPSYVLDPGRLTRTITPRVTREGEVVLPDPEEFAARISDYVRLFDAAMKSAVCGKCSAEEACAAAWETAEV